MSLQRVCVYCGSRPGARPVYLDAAKALGEELASRKITLVYGGASVGVMGALADAVLANGGSAIGIIPQRLKDKEIAHSRLTELHVVGSMHERKAQMEKYADGFIALPGGFGTFEELFEMITWAQLGLHQKPLGVVNVAGYFDGLRHQMHRSVADGFIPTDHADRVMFSPDPRKLVETMVSWRPAPLGPKWIDRNQT